MYVFASLDDVTWHPCEAWSMPWSMRTPNLTIEKIRKWMKIQISVGKSFLQAQGFYSDLLNNHVSFIGMRWDCCSRNCLVGLAMKVSVVVHLVRTVARKIFLYIAILSSISVCCNNLEFIFKRSFLDTERKQKSYSL